MSLLQFDNVTFRYEDADGQESSRPAVNGVSFSVQEGEIVAIVGHNGSGKSTLAKLCNGLYEPTEGEVYVDGDSTKDKRRLHEIRKKVGIVFQNPDNQMVATIIEDDVAFGPENLGLPSQEIRKRVDWALDAVGMSEYAQGAPFKLSGGQKQRVAIAGVLAIRPKLMILDESTAMLDPLSREEVMRVALELVKTQNMSLILITHFVEEAMQADKVLVMNDGKIEMQGGKEVFLRQKELQAIGLAVPLAVSVAAALREGGVAIDEAVMTDEELVNALCR